MNEKEREKLMDMLQQLRKELVEKQAEIDRERRDIRSELKTFVLLILSVSTNPYLLHVNSLSNN